MSAREDWQREGEADRAALCIGGTMGDAQDVPHRFAPSTFGSWCRICGLTEAFDRHREQSGG